VSIGFAAAASLIALLGASLPRGAQQSFSIVALALASVGMASSGHGGSTLLTPALAILVLHTLCILFWVGSLVPLGMILYASPIERGGILKRFSAAIPIPLVLLILTGIVLSALRLGSPTNLLSTAYGVVLAAKVGLVLALLALTAYNRFQLTPRFASVPVATSLTFTKSICAEFVIVAAIFGVLGLWRFVPPPGSVAAPERPTIAYMKGSEITALVTIAPSTTSARSIAVSLLDNNAHPIPADQVWMTLSYITLNTTPVRRLATPVGRGRFSLEGVVMPNPGLWRVQLDVLANNRRTLLDQQILVTDSQMGRLLNRQSPSMPSNSTGSMPGMDM
jgi:copper transport protein